MALFQKDNMKDYVTRPQAEDRKIHSKNEFELCYMRHQYFRKVNYNPTKEEMIPYKRIVEYIAGNTFHVYRNLFSTVGMEQDDVVSIAHIHLVNFLGLFELNRDRHNQKFDEFILKFQRKNEGQLPTDFDILSKNRADYTLFMKQRMADLVRICQQKAKNIKGMRVDQQIPFYGPNPPPEELYKLLEDNDAYGFRKLDNVAFKAAKKRVKAKQGEVFRFAGNWYVAVPIAHRNLTVLDLAGAGLDPYESIHNKNPEQLLLERQQEIRFDKRKKMFKNWSKTEKGKTIKEFIEKNAQNPIYREEIDIAKRMLRKLGIEHG